MSGWWMMQLEGGREARSPLNPKPYTLNKAAAKERATTRSRISEDDDGWYTFTKQRHETRTLLDYCSDRRKKKKKSLATSKTQAFAQNHSQERELLLIADLGHSAQRELFFSLSELSCLPINQSSWATEGAAALQAQIPVKIKAAEEKRSLALLQQLLRL